MRSHAEHSELPGVVAYEETAHVLQVDEPDRCWKEPAPSLGLSV